MTQTPLQLLSTGAANIQLQSSIKSSYNSIDELSKINTPDSTQLQADYTTFIQSTQNLINTDNGTVLPNGVTMPDLVSGVNKQNIALNARRDTIINLYITTSGNFFGAVMSEFKYYTKMAVFILGPLFGFIILTNTFYDSPNMIFKFFYGFWGALWYPLTLLFAIFDPPVWRAGIIPLVRSDSHVPFFEFWKYNMTIDIDVIAKSKTMMRLICIGLFALLLYSFVF